MSVKLFEFQDMAIQSYLISDQKTRECVVIDPPRIISAVKKHIDDNQLQLKAILETHVHADFVSGALELKNAYHSQPFIFSSVAGGTEWLPVYADRGVKDGEYIKVGALQFKVKFTPGHTPEHISWLLESENIPLGFFTGDFLFIEGVGRPDLLGSGMTDNLLNEIHKSIFERIADIPDHVPIFPAHGAGSLCSKSIGKCANSTLGQQRKSNLAFAALELKEWKKSLMQDMPAAPVQFTRIKERNLYGSPLLSMIPDDPNPLNLHHIASYEIIDFRSPQEYGKGHVRGAINVPIGKSFGNWLASVLPEKGPLLCILPNAREKERIINLLRLLGYDFPIHCVLWTDIPTSCYPVTLEAITPEALNAMSSDVMIVDVRTPEEWNEGHIEQARNIELCQIEAQMASIPRSTKVVMVCGLGYRSSIAASLFQKHGYQVRHLSGGIGAWNSSGYPIVKNT